MLPESTQPVPAPSNKPKIPQPPHSIALSIRAMPTLTSVSLCSIGTDSCAVCNRSSTNALTPSMVASGASEFIMDDLSAWYSWRGSFSILVEGLAIHSSSACKAALAFLLFSRPAGRPFLFCDDSGLRMGASCANNSLGRTRGFRGPSSFLGRMKKTWSFHRQDRINDVYGWRFRTWVFATASGSFLRAM